MTSGAGQASSVPSEGADSLIVCPGSRPDKPRNRSEACVAMHTVHRTPQLAITHQAVNTLNADLLVLPIFEADDFADLPGLDRATGGEITAAQTRRELRGSLYESFQTTLTNPEWKTRRLLLVGAGPRAAFSDERLRRLATAAGL